MGQAQKRLENVVEKESGITLRTVPCCATSGSRGMERCKDWEAVITLAMRGDGDEPMSEDANISLLQNIVKDQRKIIEKVTGKKAKETPQVWALYKEVQDYMIKVCECPTM